MEVYGVNGPGARQRAQSLLSHAARTSWGLSQLPPIVREERGKPRFAHLPQYHFNLSHSGQLLVCALSRSPVGVDIQTVKPRREAVLHRVCSDEELCWLSRRGDRPEDFALLWAMKESVCKYTGQGLRRPISAISVPLPVGDEGELRLDDLRFYCISGPDWRFSLCTTEEWNGVIRWLPYDSLMEE